MPVYQIRDRSDVLIAEHVRRDLPDGKKSMHWRLPIYRKDGPQAGLDGIPTADLPLYGSQWIDRVPVGGEIILCEGESATEALWRWRVPALGTVTGASGTPGPEALGVLLPYDVVTWEDHDEAGSKHMRRCASWLQANGNSPRRLLWGSEKGDDAADFVERGGTRSQLAQMLENATPWPSDDSRPVEQLAPQRRPAPRSERLGAWEDRREQARHLLIEAVESAWGPPVRHMGRSVWWVCRLHAGDREPSFKCDLREDFFRCLSGHTRVMTWDGPAEIRELSGGTHKILTTGGIWVDAPIQSYGEDKVSRIHLTRNGVKRIVNATADHRWLIRTDRAGVYREATTATLKTGSRLAYAYPPLGMLMKAGPAPFGVAQGFVFGDGTQTESGGAHVFFHDEKREMLRFFPESRIWGTEELPAVGRLPRFFRSLPPLTEAPGYLYGWLAGYFAADGCVSKDGQVILSSAVRDNLEYVATLASHLGIGVYSVKRQYRLGKGKEITPLYHLTFINSTLTGDFFVREKHRERFEAAMTGDRIERKGWVVDGIESTALREEVFCATVDRTHAFALEGNLLTGNCFGCGARGDIFTFKQLTEHASFKEVLLELVPPTIYGVPVVPCGG